MKFKDMPYQRVDFDQVEKDMHALMEEFEDTVLEMLGYETAAAYLDGIRKGVNLWRFLMDGDGRRQQVAAQDNAR